MQWKHFTKRHPDGYLTLKSADTGDVPVRLFLSDALFAEIDEGIYRQIVNATQFPGTKLVVITPDVHVGYGVPVGSVILTDRREGAVAMGPVGFDIGCGMVSARSSVPADAATPDRRLAFNRAVTERVALDVGGVSRRFGELGVREFEEVVRGGAEEYSRRYGQKVDRSRAERNRIPVRDSWKIPWGGAGRPERGRSQLGTLGGGNHFIELQGCEDTGTLFVQIHTGSRGFGHGLATNYFQLAKAESPAQRELDLGYFTPSSANYLDAVAAGGNFAIVNRLALYEEVAAAFRKVFREELELVYEISHNLVQAEEHPEFGKVWTHRKGATRAFPAGHAALVGTPWEHTGHPVLVPGSNRDYSYILRPREGAVRSAWSVNHGSGRRMSRSEASRVLSQDKVDEQYRRDGIVVNLDGRVPIDEAGPCYKKSESVIGAIVDAGLAVVEHRLWPLASIKGVERGAAGRRQRERRARDKDRDRERRPRR